MLVYRVIFHRLVIRYYFCLAMPRLLHGLFNIVPSIIRPLIHDHGNNVSRLFENLVDQ